MRNGVEITEPRRTNPQGLTGTLATPRAAKGGRLDGGRGDLNGLAARGCMGPTGTWGAGLGRQDSKHRDGQWRTVVVDACQVGQAVQYRNRGENWVQIVVQLSQRVAYGEGVGTQRVTGMIQKIFEMVGR